MASNYTRHIKLPFSNAVIKSHTGRTINKTGTGMGSVLLQTGGPGVGSSYMDIDDYIATTGINPYARAGVKKKKGEGITKELSSKLSKLNVLSDGVKRKNITMSF